MTTTIGETDTDLDILNALDFEYTPPCEHTISDKNDCDKPAEWKGTFSCCGKIILLCNKHKEGAVEFLKSIGGRGFHARHLGGCGSTKATIGNWERI